MTPFAAVVGGGGAGLAGAAGAHVLTTFLDRALGAEQWLRGPYGPQFFPIAFYSGVFYGAIGAAAGRRAATALLGFLGAFLGIAATMALLSRYPGWGMPRGADGTPQWQLAVLAVYSLSIWGTIAALGAAAAPAPRWRGALVAVLGSFAAYLLLTAILKAAPEWSKSPWNPISYIPNPVNLLDGIASGAGLCLALSLDERFRKRNS